MVRRQQKNISLPIDLCEVVENDKEFILSYFVESALRNYYNVRTKETAEIKKKRQKLENDLSILESDKDNYLNEYENKKAQINFQLSQLDDMEKTAIENDTHNEVYDNIVEFLRLNKNAPKKQFPEYAEKFIAENNIDIVDVEGLQYLKNNLNPIKRDTLKEALQFL